MAPTKSLSTYLQDHLAGAAAGSEIAGKIADKYREPPLGPFLSELAREIAHDKDTLEQLMGELGVQPDAFKQAAGWVAEKLSRLKLNDHGDEDLGRLMEFEMLSLGIEGKLALWRSLQQVQGAHPALAGADLPGLIKRAESQLDGLEEHRLAAARGCLTAG